jgi:hypothetical protein
LCGIKSSNPGRFSRRESSKNNHVMDMTDCQIREELTTSELVEWYEWLDGSQ